MSGMAIPVVCCPPPAVWRWARLCVPPWAQVAAGPGRAVEYSLITASKVCGAARGAGWAKPDPWLKQRDSDMVAAWVNS